MPSPRPRRLPAETYAEGVLASDRVLLSRAVTLVESRRPEDRALARKVLERVMPRTGRSIRVGVTGVPGVGKSTFIEALGKRLTAAGRKVAVLAVDPTSQRTQGSIMGDKTRMEALARDPSAYIRPSPSGQSLGGVAARTRETMLLCEAAGFDTVVVETVGVGQSETAVRGMTDFFLLLMLAGAGDELQGIKKGIMEMADLVAINKADGANKRPAEQARVRYRNAMHLFQANPNGWTPRVATCSSTEKEGLGEVWQAVEDYRAHTEANGWFERQRREQRLVWLREAVRLELETAFFDDEAVQALGPELERQVAEGTLPPAEAAARMVSAYRRG